METKMALQMNIYDFKYTIRYNPYLGGKEGNGSAACSYIAEDILSKILYNGGSDALNYESRYFSHTMFIQIGSYYWTISVDMDLLDFNKFEIVAVDYKYDAADIRVHVKDGKWFDTINQLQSIDSIREAVIMYITVEKLIKKLRSTFVTRSNTVLAEKYAGDFK
jgi:hypothetical protein